MPLLELKNVCYSYPLSGKAALEDICFSVNKGDYIAVLGLNGSGKSTLARLIAGFFEPSSGKILREKEMLPGIVFQQPKEQVVAGIVERDTAFGPQNLNMTEAEIELRTIECLSVVSLADRAMDRTCELSLGQTQRLAFSGILALFPDLLILDEATAMLDPDSKSQLIEFVNAWNCKGHTVITVTHDLDEALCAQRILVMDRGQIAFDGTPRQFKESRTSFEKIFGESAEYTSFKDSSVKKNTSAETVLKADRLSFSYGERTVFQDISFELKKGTLTALTGPSGCGKSTLFECLAGLKKFQGGKIYAMSRPVLGLQESEAALFEPYAADDVAFGPKNRNISGKKLLERVKNSMELAGLDYRDFGNAPVHSLSGGEKRKLSVAGLIALDSDILIFDEPTAGLDPLSRKKLLASFRTLAESGKTVLFSTHRLQEAEAADVQIQWENLSSKSKITNASEESSLPEMKPLENSALLEKLSKAASVFSAPGKIPESPVTRLSAGKKTALFAILFFSSILLPFPVCAGMILVNIGYALLSKCPLKNTFRIAAKLLPWIILFSLLGIILFPVYEGDTVLFSWHAITVTRTKLFLFAGSFIHSLCAVSAIGTFFFIMDERQAMDGISDILKPLKLIHFPVRCAVLIVGIVFRFIPLLLDEFSGIIKTQIIRGAFGSARGIKKIKAIIPVFVPLVLQTIRKARCLADALTARYFK
ncbi:energy-coupling factor transporter ATPase [Treponema sp.]|uniref:energy-coupling factor transporter ATPase n=1 Tax=Treponema sp. TaxID=166 RepID=UPI003F04BA6F